MAIVTLQEYLAECLIENVGEACDLIGHGMCRGLGLVLDDQERLDLPVKEALGEVEHGEGPEGVVHGVWGRPHPLRREHVERLLGDEREDLRDRVRLGRVQLEVGDRVRLEAVRRQGEGETLDRQRERLEVRPVQGHCAQGVH